MSDISKALQGKMKGRNGHIKDLPESQLDLFSSLSGRAASMPARPAPKPIASTVQEAPPEVDFVLPPPGDPPDVSAEVRSVLSDSRTVRPVQPVDSSADGRPLLRTGIYRRPKRPIAPPPPVKEPKPPRAAGSLSSILSAFTGFLSGVELDRRLVSLVLVLIVLVALIATWTSCPRQPAGDRPGTLLDLSAVEPVTPEMSVPVAAVVPVVVVEPPSPQPSVPAENWKVRGTVATRQGTAIHVRFEDAVFVSSEKISVKGMRALKAVAKKLLTMKSGAQVTVIGYTDNVPLSKPTLQFRSNKELAELRAKVAVDHLTSFSRANKALEFVPQAGAPEEAPYPNDTSKSRRLNRTVTLQVTPAP